MRQRAHLHHMSKKKPATAKPFVKPAHWISDPAPEPKQGKVDEELSPTRYGDWEKNGIAVDF